MPLKTWSSAWETLSKALRKEKGVQALPSSSSLPLGICKQRHVDADMGGGRVHAPSRRNRTAWGGGRSRRTAARQGDPTAFLAGVSAPLPSPSAEISDPSAKLGRPSSQGERLPREGQGKGPSPGTAWQFPTEGETLGHRP